ncbi:MAG: regulatory signaling modulator protein AmpE [Halioglobus sp.]
MTFLAMIAAIIVLSVHGDKSPVHEDDWFASLQNTCRGFGFSPTVSLVVYVAAPVFLVEFMLSAVDSWLFGLIWLAGASLVLLYSFGREPFDTLTQRYRSYCRSGDFEAAYLYAEEELDIDPQSLDVTSPETAHEAIQARLLYLGYQRWFAVLFFFLLVGPIAALAYRLLQLSRQSRERAIASSILFYLDWLPTRLLAAGFALTGNFLSSRDELLASVSESRQDSGSVLMSVGRAAIGASRGAEPDQQHPFSEIASQETVELRDLMSRSAGAWLIVISLIVLFL